MLRLTLYILIWFGSMGLAIFSSQNISPVTVKFLSLESIKLPLGLLLIGCGGLGAVLITSMMTFLKPAQPISGDSQPNRIFDRVTNIPKPQPNNPQKNLDNKNISNKRRSKSDMGDAWDDDWNDDWS